MGLSVPKKRDNAEEQRARLDALVEEYRVETEALKEQVANAKKRMAKATGDATTNTARARELRRAVKRR